MDYPGEKLVIKLWETIIEKGIGGIFRPWQLKREGQVTIELKCEELVKLAKAETKADAIRSGFDIITAQNSLQGGDRTQINTALIADVSMEIVAEQLRRDRNVANALLAAEEFLSQDAELPSDSKIDSDWIYRWRDSAAQVSNEKLQDLWGRILAGELKSPGTYSLRTIEFLKSISKEEADIILEIAPFIFQGRIFRGEIAITDDHYLDKYGLTYILLRQVQYLGLINGVEMLGMQTTFNSASDTTFMNVITNNTNALVINGDNPKAKFILNTYCLTKMGLEIFKLVSAEGNAGYFKEVGLCIKKQKLSVQFGKFERLNNNEIRLHSLISLE